MEKRGAVGEGGMGGGDVKLEGMESGHNLGLWVIL